MRKNLYRFSCKLVIEIQDYHSELAQEKINKIKFILPSNSKLSSFEIQNIIKLLSNEEILVTTLRESEIDALDLTEYQLRILLICMQGGKTIYNCYKILTEMFIKYPTEERFQEALKFLIMKKYLKLVTNET